MPSTQPADDAELASDDLHDDRGAMRWLASAAVLFVGAGGCWLLAFTSSLGAPSPLLVVGMPSEAVAGDRLPIRVVAIDEATRSQKFGAFTVAFKTPSTVAPLLKHQVDAVPSDVPVPDQRGVVDVVVTGPLNDEAPGSVTAQVELVDRLPSRARFAFRPWAKSALTQGGPPVYPLDGDVLATQPSTVLLLLGDLAAPTLVVEDVRGNTAQTLDSTGRALRIERKDVRLDVPLSVAPGAALTVRASPEEPLELDLLVDGVARRSTVIRGQAQLTLPADARPGAPFVVHVSRRPFPQGRGVFHVGRVGSGGLPDTIAWARTHVRAAGGHADPLLALLDAGTLSAKHQELAVRALLRRLVPDQLRAERAGASSEQQRLDTHDARRAGIDRWRLPFRLLALLFALAALIGTYRLSPSVGPVGLDLDGERDASTSDGPLPLGDKRRTRLWGALGLAVALSLLGLLDWTLG